MRCLSCHYELKKLPENRCPECGREFDPNDPKTYLADSESRRSLLRQLLIVAAVCYGLNVCFVVYMAIGENYYGSLFLLKLPLYALLLMPFTLVPGIAVYLVAWIIIRSLKGRASPR